MSPASIAFNRFGYGARAGETPPADPRRYLLAQLDAFDPAPPQIAGRITTRGKTGELVQLIRGLRREQREMAGMAESMAEPGGMAMSGEDRRAAALAGLPPELREQLMMARQALAGDIAARVQLAVASPTPMAERLVHFWANHFSVSAGKLGTQFEVGPHEFAAIRPRVLGRFADLLKAAVLHPAMLIYLDQFQSIGPNAPITQRRGRRGGRDAAQRPRGLNENLAREVLELHTLGVDGGYDQADVTELARALTGWTVPGLGRVGRLAEDQPGGAAFVAMAHEPGARQVLGRRYPEGGARQALAILDDLAAHPATARHIATKFARHFAADTPPPALVDRLEADFRKTGGDLASLTRTLIASPEAWESNPRKFRAPFEWLVGVLRLTGGAEAMPPQRVMGALTQLGQVPWRAPSPAGYDDIAASWAGPDALVRRVEFAERIARSVPQESVITRAEAAFPGALSTATRDQLTRAESGSQALALLLVSPEMLRR
ncbi:hypothetical protein CHX26_12940 [Porphyrobacter sp. HT-58-2]|uniref:DUF1800 domain-containing protein n=1 Tax=Porphyrobacter sp. HT-58-2 TaxID=2023229 RepID=UPI000CDCC221|nr:DUF1800 domain-containing protein [Porphyrobacter sp. HT-58-2]AUX70281.1 hypothetical protein CHX26_12940 [Porphyrobacter sp. HT-58-2]